MTGGTTPTQPEPEPNRPPCDYCDDTGYDFVHHASTGGDRPCPVCSRHRSGGVVRAPTQPDRPTCNGARSWSWRTRCLYWHPRVTMEFRAGILGVRYYRCPLCRQGATVAHEGIL